VNRGNNDPELRKVLAAFAMPSVQTMVSRKSSLTNAFVNSLIPVIAPTAEEVGEALRILGQSHDDVRCAYCGDKSSEWDHLRPLVRGRKPTGHISEIGNLVPSCGKCNQSKGNKNWRDWMLGKSPLSPAMRGVEDLQTRVARLESFEMWRPSEPIEFEHIVGSAPYSKYWVLLDKIIESLASAQLVAASLRSKIAAVHGGIDSRSKVERVAVDAESADDVLPD
jgi:hypothetical protein